MNVTGGHDVTDVRSHQPQSGVDQRDGDMAALTSATRARTAPRTRRPRAWNRRRDRRNRRPAAAAHREGCRAARLHRRKTNRRRGHSCVHAPGSGRVVAGHLRDDQSRMVGAHRRGSRRSRSSATGLRLVTRTSDVGKQPIRGGPAIRLAQVEHDTSARTVVYLEAGVHRGEPRRRRSEPGPRAGSPPGGSILMTSAPQSASTVAQDGPAAKRPISTTLIPPSGAAGSLERGFDVPGHARSPLAKALCSGIISR